MHLNNQAKTTLQALSSIVLQCYIASYWLY